MPLKFQGSLMISFFQFADPLLIMGINRSFRCRKRPFGSYLALAGKCALSLPLFVRLHLWIRCSVEYLQLCCSCCWILIRLQIECRWGTKVRFRQTFGIWLLAYFLFSPLSWRDNIHIRPALRWTYFDVAGGATHASLLVGMTGWVECALNIGSWIVFQFVRPLIIMFLIVDRKYCMNRLALLCAFNLCILEPLVSRF